MTKIWENTDLCSSLAIVFDLVFDMHLTCNACQYLDMYCIIPQASESIPEQVMGEKQIRLQGLFFLLFWNSLPRSVPYHYYCILKQWLGRDR